MLPASSGSSAKHAITVGSLVASATVLFALLIQLVIGLASAPAPSAVTGSFSTNRSADYHQAPLPPVAPQRTG